LIVFARNMFVVTLLAKGVMSKVFTLCSMFPLLRDLSVIFTDSKGLKYHVKSRIYGGSLSLLSL